MKLLTNCQKKMTTMAATVRSTNSLAYSWNFFQP